ncbi:restriction endonuclease [Apilactobacillus xinyiensis]|uniref:Restriction endonuclease n=1 Tax=Apilactobacillus xinyiensis TaxID=2841032 RepID=A0ABT0I2P2_9LACO|nr:restriction endonuclease [Apilactobacillus xinyiensis]MCK8624991.1 restriction endonuclease [Apilactobacillus xinyiensis]MCL0319452.1 restriction endonuclease [Apilactobacillus xinyiensis]
MLDKLLSGLDFIIQYIGLIFYFVISTLYNLIVNLYKIFTQNSKVNLKDNLNVFVSNLDAPDTFSLLFLGILLIFLIFFRLTKRRKIFSVKIKKKISSSGLSVKGTTIKRNNAAKYKRITNRAMRKNHFNVTANNFEYMIGYLFYRSGFKSIVTQQSNDFGLDVVATHKNKKYGIQCKLYNSYVGVEAIQQAVTGTVAYGLDVPIVVCSSNYTKAAQDLADASGTLVINHEMIVKWYKNPNYIFKILKDV